MIVVGLFLSLSFIFGLFYLCNTQESSQVKVKENTMNLNCTALENGEYLCKKPK